MRSIPSIYLFGIYVPRINQSLFRAFFGVSSTRLCFTIVKLIINMLSKKHCWNHMHTLLYCFRTRDAGENRRAPPPWRLISARDGAATARPPTWAAWTPAQPVFAVRIKWTGSAPMQSRAEMVNETPSTYVPEGRARWRRRTERGISQGRAPPAPGQPSAPALRCRGVAARPIGLTTAATMAGNCMQKWFQRRKSTAVSSISAVLSTEAVVVSWTP